MSFERRQLNAEHRKPEKEVFAEIAGGDLLFEIAVGGGDDPQIDLRRTGFADFDEFAAFEYAQQLGLQLDGHFADFVEKQRSPVSLLKKPFLVFRGARETPGAVPEQFAFEQLLGDGRTVDRHERLLGAGTGMVYRLREDLLAGSGFAGEQDRGVRRGDLARQCDGLPESFRRTDDAVERMFVGEFLLEAGQPALHLGFLRGPAQQREYLVVVVAFGDVVERSVLDGLHAVGDVAVGRQQNHLGRRRRLLDLPDHLHAVAVGQLDVAQNHVGIVLPEHFETCGAVGGLCDLVTFKPDDPGQKSAQLLFVVDNQNLRHMFFSVRSRDERDRIRGKYTHLSFFSRPDQIYFVGRTNAARIAGVWRSGWIMLQESGVKLRNFSRLFVSLGCNYEIPQ